MWTITLALEGVPLLIYSRQLSQRSSVPRLLRRPCYSFSLAVILLLFFSSNHSLFFWSRLPHKVKVITLSSAQGWSCDFLASFAEGDTLTLGPGWCIGRPNSRPSSLKVRVNVMAFSYIYKIAQFAPRGDFSRERGINNNVLSEIEENCRDPLRVSKTLAQFERPPEDWEIVCSVCVHCSVLYYPNNHQ